MLLNSQCFFSQTTVDSRNVQIAINIGGNYHLGHFEWLNCTVNDRSQCKDICVSINSPPILSLMD